MIILALRLLYWKEMEKSNVLSCLPKMAKSFEQMR